MPSPLADALAALRPLLVDADRLVRAVAAGPRRGASLVRAELRPVVVRGDRRVQVVTNDGSRPFARNLAVGPDYESTVDSLLAEPFGNWHVETLDRTVQVRVTKRGDAQVHSAAIAAAAAGPVAAAAGPVAAAAGPVAAGHDRVAAHLLAPDDPLFDVIGGSAAKRRQVDAFLRSLSACVGSPVGPLRVVDLGCGNAYLTFAAYRYLSGLGVDVTMTGVDVRDDQRVRNSSLASQLGWSSSVRFVAGSIADAAVDEADLVLALHACDTATDEALARAVGWKASWILAAPCCHHDIAAQLGRGAATPDPYQPLTRHGILRQRFADVLTDSLRASLLRLHGYRVDVVEFIESAHTARNLLLRAVLTGAPATTEQHRQYRDLVGSWKVEPRLQTLIGAPDLHD